MVLGFDFDRLRSGPFEGPAIVKPPALPGDTYYDTISDGRRGRWQDVVRRLIQEFDRIT